MLKNFSSTHPLAFCLCRTLAVPVVVQFYLLRVCCHKNWSSDERLKSSTWRELTAVHLGLDSFKKFISCKSIYWFSDNQSAVHIIENGSEKLVLQAAAIDIFETCLRYDIFSIPRWIPRDNNQAADVISKLIDYDDWFVANQVFYLLDSLWARIPWTGSLTNKIQSSKGLTHYFGRQTAKQSMLSHRTGKVKITGLFLPYF